MFFISITTFGLSSERLLARLFHLKNCLRCSLRLRKASDIVKLIHRAKEDGKNKMELAYGNNDRPCTVVSNSHVWLTSVRFKEISLFFLMICPNLVMKNTRWQPCSRKRKGKDKKRWKWEKENGITENIYIFWPLIMYLPSDASLLCRQSRYSSKK